MDWKDFGAGGFGAAIGGVLTFLWTVFRQRRQDRLAEAKQGTESAVAEKKLAIELRDQTLEEITALHERFERVWERFDRTDADLRETRAELGVAQLKILECETRDTQKAQEIIALTARDGEKAQALELANARLREQAALLHSLQTEVNELRRDHYGVVETATSAVEKVEELCQTVGVSGIDLPDMD